MAENNIWTIKKTTKAIEEVVTNNLGYRYGETFAQKYGELPKDHDYVLRMHLAFMDDQIAINSSVHEQKILNVPDKYTSLLRYECFQRHPELIKTYTDMVEGISNF